MYVCLVQGLPHVSLMVSCTNSCVLFMLTLLTASLVFSCSCVFLRSASGAGVGGAGVPSWDAATCVSVRVSPRLLPGSPRRRVCCWPMQWLPCDLLQVGGGQPQLWLCSSEFRLGLTCVGLLIDSYTYPYLLMHLFLCFHLMACTLLHLHSSLKIWSWKKYDDSYTSLKVLFWLHKVLFLLAWGFFIMIFVIPGQFPLLHKKG